MAGGLCTSCCVSLCYTSDLPAASSQFITAGPVGPVGGGVGRSAEPAAIGRRQRYRRGSVGCGSPTGRSLWVGWALHCLSTFIGGVFRQAVTLQTEP